MLSPYAKYEWLTITAIGLLLTTASFVVGWWWLIFLILPVTAALLAFFRDPSRKTPSQRGAMIAPADGRISSIHEVEHFEPFEGPATCIRIFLSVLDVHINRSPCHGHVKSVAHKPGDHKNALSKACCLATGASGASKTARTRARRRPSPSGWLNVVSRPAKAMGSATIRGSAHYHPPPAPQGGKGRIDGHMRKLFH